MLILHYTGMPDAASALARLTDPAAQVSAHWLVDEDGTTYRLVDETRRAWHGGVSCWAGRDGLNDVSIGVEIVNPGHEHGYRPFPEAQMAAVEALCRGIVGRWAIRPARVLAHSDVAPARKEDPGELFDWPRLARAGIGLWPDEVRPDAAPVPEAAFRALLRRFGYCCPDDMPTSTVTVAFQRHFRPRRVDGRPDAECAAILERLIRLAAA